MKKLIIPLCALVVVSITSCAKDYSCTCRTISTNTSTTEGEDPQVSTDTYTETYDVKEAKSHQAQAACNEATITTSDSYTFGQTTVVYSDETTCELSK